MSRKQMTIVLILILALGAGWYLWRRPPRVWNSNPYGKNVILFGDSLASGYGVAPEKCFAHLLAQKLDTNILNAGWPGDTTRLAMERFESDVLARNPKVVLIELGGNDLLQQIPRAETTKNLATMIEQSQSGGAAVVLLGVDGPLGMGGLGKMYEGLSREYKTGLVKNIMKGILGHPKRMTDQIHPNEEGHRIIAERVETELRRALPKVFDKPSNKPESAERSAE